MMKRNTENFYSADVFDRSISTFADECDAAVIANNCANAANAINVNFVNSDGSSLLTATSASTCDCLANNITTSSDGNWESFTELKNRISALENLVKKNENESKKIGIGFPRFNAFRSKRKDFATLDFKK